MSWPVQEKSGVPSVLNQVVPSAGKLPAPSVFNRDTLQVSPAVTVACLPFVKDIWEKIVAFFSSIFAAAPSTGGSVTAAQIAEIKRISDEKHFFKFYLDPFGNFHPCPIKLWGHEFPCAEAAFQAGKFKDNPSKMIQFTTSQLNPTTSIGDAAWRLGQTLSQTWTQEQTNAWFKRNLNVMREVVMAKYTQHPDLKKALVATGNAYLVEHTSRDGFWGDKGDGTGKNHLGHILMETREKVGGKGRSKAPKEYWDFIADRLNKA